MSDLITTDSSCTHFFSAQDEFNDALSAVTNTGVLSSEEISLSISAVSHVADDESWDDEDACLLDENVAVRQPRSKPFCPCTVWTLRMCHGDNHDTSQEGCCALMLTSVCDDLGWDDEPSFLLRENDTAVGRTGERQPAVIFVPKRLRVWILLVIACVIKLTWS